jgi:hypothetical protein
LVLCEPFATVCLAAAAAAAAAGGGGAAAVAAHICDATFFTHSCVHRKRLSDNSRTKFDAETNPEGYSVGSWVVHSIITAVTIIVVAIPEGLVRSCSCNSDSVSPLLGDCVACCDCHCGELTCAAVVVAVSAFGRHDFAGLLYSEDVEGPEPNSCAGCVRDDGQRHGHLQ